MKKQLLILLIWLPVWAISQSDSIVGGVYPWKAPTAKSKAASSILFEGRTQDMDWLQVSANAVQFSKQNKKNNLIVSDKEEQLIIVKSGAMVLGVKDSTYAIGSGSIALLLPGENYLLRNDSQLPCQYYLIKYRSKLPVDTARGRAAGGSLVKDWNKTVFKPGEKGGRRNFLERPTAMCKRLEIHVTTLKDGLKSHAPHTHRAAEFTIIKEGQTEMQIGDQFYSSGEGGIYYAPSLVLHALENKGAGNCTYFAIQFE